MRKKVSLFQIRSAIETMLRLGVIARDSKGKLIATPVQITTKSDIPMEAGRLHHQQMLLRASEAIQEQSVDAREFDSKTFRMNPRRLAQAKKEWREFREAYLSKYESSDGTHVFQLGFQLFSHTQDLKGESK